MIEAVIFDIDGVLLDSHRANTAYYSGVLRRYGYPAVPDSELAYGHSHTLRETIAYLTKAEEAVVDSIFEETRDLAGYPYELVLQPPGCLEVLEALSAEYALGVMSSRIVEGIRQYLDLTGTHERFSTVVGYEDSTHHKPHPEPLLLACERLDVAPDAAIYVGDAPTDRLCALSAGAHFIAFGDAIPEAERVVATFHELVTEIEQLTRHLDGTALKDARL